MTNKWTFTCPQCGGHDITIEASVYLRVIQNPETGDYNVSQIDGEPIYDTDDFAQCDDCGYSGRLQNYCAGGEL
jgi:hypothetical protein